LLAWVESSMIERMPRWTHRLSPFVSLRRGSLAALGFALTLSLSGAPSDAQTVPVSAAPELPPQTILAPGLYLFQTRTRDGTCDDAPRTGYVTSAVATLDGVPGSRTMTMQLLNSKWWPTWTLSVAADDTISGSANWQGGKDPALGSSRFEMRAKKERFQGLGSRDYLSKAEGQPKRCTLHYDALLKELD
jgi:hypothetical protein